MADGKVEMSGDKMEVTSRARGGGRKEPTTAPSFDVHGCLPRVMWKELI